MSSWLRSSQQELCREKQKQPNCFPQPERKPLFLAAALQSDQGFKYVISPDHKEAAEAIDIPLMSKKGWCIQTFQKYSLLLEQKVAETQAKWCAQCLPSLYFLFLMEPVQLHHNSLGGNNWQQHGGQLKNCLNSKIIKKVHKKERCQVLWTF